MWKKLTYVSLGLILLSVFSLWLLANKPVPEEIEYGMSFNTLYARELGLDWREAYDAIVDDLGVKNLRLAAHWPMIEPVSGVYNFEELDYQIEKAEKSGVSVILAIGRRLPRWPECHIPGWARELSGKERNSKQLRYVEEVVTRYKNNPAVIMWQVENEPFLEVFAFEHCGKLNENLLKKEIALVKRVDPSRQVLVTDSGNLGTWTGAYSNGDVFGTSVYVHFWNPDLGQFRTILPAWAYRVKENIVSIFYGKKETMLIELSAEPWLLEPIVDVPLEVQFGRMNLEKFEDILNYAEKTRFDKQYLWGAEWWYWLYLQGHPEMWERGQRLFVKDELKV